MWPTGSFCMVRIENQTLMCTSNDRLMAELALSSFYYLVLFNVRTPSSLSSLLNCLSRPQVWNVRSARHLSWTPSWTGGSSAPYWSVQWTWNPALNLRMRVHYRTSSQQGAPCLLRRTDLRGRKSSGATRCVTSATSSSTLPLRPRFTTTANPTRRDWRRSATARRRTAQVGPQTHRGFLPCHSAFRPGNYYQWEQMQVDGVAHLCVPSPPPQCIYSTTVKQIGLCLLKCAQKWAVGCRNKHWRRRVAENWMKSQSEELIKCRLCLMVVFLQVMRLKWVRALCHSSHILDWTFAAVESEWVSLSLSLSPFSLLYPPLSTLRTSTQETCVSS